MAIADESHWSELLRQGLGSLSIEASPEQQQKLLNYLDLLAKWGKTYNLTKILEPRQMIIQHLLDSLSIMSYIPPGKLLDVGAGAGLPGIPLSILLPSIEVTLLDSVSRKTRFMQQACLQLPLDNVTVQTGRVEALDCGPVFDGIICRAFASLEEIVAKVGNLCKKDGVIIAMKGLYPGKELEAIRQAGLFCQVHALQVPFLEAERHVVLIKSDE